MKYITCRSISCCPRCLQIKIQAQSIAKSTIRTLLYDFVAALDIQFIPVLRKVRGALDIYFWQLQQEQYHVDPTSPVVAGKLIRKSVVRSAE